MYEAGDLISSTAPKQTNEQQKLKVKQKYREKFQK